ncbi:TPA: hypothetical protein CPT95_08490 [Candidatus Gastranaerophilales bacterium HUM_15]|jgi:hypothetical protein|nr:hypothetical protein [Acinetobacter sp.]DAB07557.1 MAG TPA: hypothetical protein CPT95_08490 [Candidatus Gastranaerophilales bacterium HUM_15]DAB14447.1 MAG TPA: hypothetical protein CPT97_08295 [Candidatus Gastranaerophilales bacterium HUM_17]DAB26148.1 MAG TPA: hypothetical protein CPT86_03945 [Candidatus Gastranaerophilales bacterium HUM_23]
MEINPINNIAGINLKSLKKSTEPEPQKSVDKSENLIKELDKMSMINNVNIGKKDYELNLSMEELEKRTHKDYLTTKKMLAVDAPEYLELEEGDKEALKHLVKAAVVLDKVNMQLDNPNNLPFKEYLEAEISKGNEQAKLTKILFDAQKGVCSLDRESNMIELIKGVSERPGKGVYPQDLEKDEFHAILIKMLKDGKVDDVAKILNQRSVVERVGNELVATDYVDKFKDDFAYMASELEKAAETSTNADFNEFLILQAKALRTADPMLDAYADKKWATLQDTPLEFTITRENYSDELTETVVENPELKALLDENGIIPVAKDFLGGRVGIINKKGTDAILGVKNYLPLMAHNMPFKDDYIQNISPDKESKQTMVDADLVAVTGDVGEFRAGITLAENLPNDDKLSIKELDGGRRNVYHRQIRLITSEDAREKMKKRLAATVNPELHQYYNDEADHWFTVGHENGHSLGPKSGTEGLGKYKSIIEENKADMISLAMLDVLTEAGMYTPEQRKQIIVTYAADNMMTSKPTLSQAHRVRSVMQNYYFIKEGAMEISPEGILNVDIEKMVPTARKMLEEIIQVQMKGDFSKGEKYVLDNFVWTPEMETMAQNIKKVSKTLNGKVESPLADKLLES